MERVVRKQSRGGEGRMKDFCLPYTAAKERKQEYSKRMIKKKFLAACLLKRRMRRTESYGSGR